VLAIEILALSDRDLATRLAGYRADQTRMVIEDPSNEDPL
jgi:phosphoribosylcarboxyaminoimidazole (NCAIR) mutase